MTDNNGKNAGNDDKPLNLNDLSDDFSSDGSDIRVVDGDSGSTNPSQETSQALEKMKSDFLYLRAEFDNYKRQSIKERSDLIKFGAERLIVDLLDVLDIFDRALSTDVNEENLASFRDGVELTAQEMKKVLVKFGVSDLDSKGKPFNPAIHEALSSEETDAVESGHISQVFKKAYKLHDKVIRPAQVIVAREKSNDSQAADTDNTSSDKANTDKTNTDK